MFFDITGQRLARVTLDMCFWPVGPRLPELRDRADLGHAMMSENGRNRVTEWLQCPSYPSSRLRSSSASHATNSSAAVMFDPTTPFRRYLSVEVCGLLGSCWL